MISSAIFYKLRFKQLTIGTNPLIDEMNTWTQKNGMITYQSIFMIFLEMRGASYPIEIIIMSKLSFIWKIGLLFDFSFFSWITVFIRKYSCPSWMAFHYQQYFCFFLRLSLRYMTVVMLYLLQHTQFSRVNFNSSRPRDEISLVNIDIVNTVNRSWMCHVYVLM